MKNNKERVLAALLLGGVLSLMPSAVAENETIMFGLKGYRTGFKSRAYTPVVFRVADSGSVGLAGGAAILPCSAVVFVHSGKIPDLKQLQTSRKPAELRVARPSEPSPFRRRFDEDLKLATPGSYGLILGLTHRDPKRHYQSASHLYTEGLDPIIFFPNERDLPKWVKSAEIYARLGTAASVDNELWDSVVSIPQPEVRFAALRDVLCATYHGGFRRRHALKVRAGLFEKIVAAIGDDLTDSRWLSLQMSMEAMESEQTVQYALLRDTKRWIAAASSGDARVAECAMGLAVPFSNRPSSAHVALQLVSAYLRRSEPSTVTGIRISETLLREAPVSSHISRTISRGLIDKLSRALKVHEGKYGESLFWKLVLAFVKKFPSMAQELAKSPDGISLRDGVERSVRSSKANEVTKEIEQILQSQK